MGKTNYPMMAIHGKKVCVLEDLRASTFGLGWDAYLVWWEGQPLPVPMPQNHHKGPLDYTDRAPVFATGGGKLRIPLREALELGLDPNVQNDMMDKRWVYFQFTKSFDGDQRRAVKPCGRCFAQWVISGVPAPSAVPAPAASSAAVPSAAATAAPLSPTPPASSGAAPIPAAARRGACRGRLAAAPFLEPASSDGDAPVPGLGEPGVLRRHGHRAGGQQAGRRREGGSREFA